MGVKKTQVVTAPLATSLPSEWKTTVILFPELLITAGLVVPQAFTSWLPSLFTTWRATLLHIALHTAHCTLHTAHCTLHTELCPLYTLYWTWT